MRRPRSQSTLKSPIAWASTRVSKSPPSFGISSGGPFRAPGYYRTSLLAETLGTVVRWALPWTFNFTTLLIARKVHHVAGE